MIKGTMNYLLVLLLCTAIITGTLTGCINVPASDTTDDKIVKPVTYDPNSPTGGLSLPLTTNENIKLTYWVPLNQQAKGMIQSYNDNLAIQELEKRTGVRVEFLHPPIGQEIEQYKLLISSNDLPDIIEERGTALYPGGGDKAIEDKAFIRLNELIEKYAPNYNYLRKSNEQIGKLTITDAGNIWSFSMIQNFDALVWAGLIIRKDYLDSINMAQPTNISEWYAVLTAMKNNGVEIPLLFPQSGMEYYGAFMGVAYGIGPGFFKEDDVVKFGPYDPRMKEYLTEMNKWYNEGLIDKDFPSRDAKMLESLATSGKAGAWFGTSGVEIERYIIAGRAGNEKYALYGCSYPKTMDGKKPAYRQVDWKVRNYNAAITTSCKYPELATQWMDYRYSKEGSLLFNYGLEGVSLKFMDNGEPDTMDKELMELPEYKGMAWSSIMWKYKINDGAMNRMNTAPLEKLIPESQQARVEWGESATIDNILPPLTLTAAEATEYNSIMNEVNTYKDSMILKFIIGAEPLDKFDDYREQLKKLNIEKAIEIQQAAYDRFLKR
jgi:putative aldouronate transport system substrate-binding protein